MEQRENDSLLDVCLEVSAVEGRPTRRDNKPREPLNYRVNRGDLHWLCLSKVTKYLEDRWKGKLRQIFLLFLLFE